MFKYLCPIKIEMNRYQDTFIDVQLDHKNLIKKNYLNHHINSSDFIVKYKL